MNISKYGKASLTILSFLVAADMLTTGGVGTFTAATLGLSSTVLLSLKEALQGVSLGFLANQVSKASDKFNEISLEKALVKAISNTLKSIKRDFYSNEAYRVKLKARLDHLLGSGVPSEEILNQDMLEKYYIQPLYKAFQDDKVIKKIINENKHLKPEELITEIIRANNIQLPQYKAEQQKLIFKALTEGFNERFLHYFDNELKANKQAQTIYHTRLIHCAITRLEQLDLGQEEIQDNLQILLDFAKQQTIYLQDIIGHNKQIATYQKELAQGFYQFRQTFLDSRKLLLTIHREKRKDVRDQFKYESLFTDFTGRERELELFRNFLADDRKFCWYMLSGEGGTGKSRLANDICLRVEAMDWIAGFSNLGHNKDFLWETITPPANMLLVFDYVKVRPEEVERILGILASIEGLQYKVRMLLIDRQFDKELIERLSNSKTRYGYYAYFENQEEQPYRLSFLEEEARWAIIKQLVQGTEYEVQILSRKDEIIAQLDAQDQLKRPLFAFFSGIALAEGQDIKNWNVHDNLRYHIQRQENKIWSRIELWQKHKQSIKNLIWLATISEYLNYHDILQVMGAYDPLLDFQRNARGHLTDGDFRQLEELFLFIGEKQDGLKEGDYLGIKPDLLGEYYIVTHLQEILNDNRYNSLAFLLVQAAWHIRPERVWWMTYLTFQNFHETAGLKWMVHWITTTDFSKMKRVAPFIAQFFFGLGVFYHDQQKWEQAEEFYLQAINKGHVVALNNLASLYYNQEKWNKAEEFYLQVIEKGYVGAMYNLALLYQNQGELEKAEEFYLQAIEKGYIGAMYNLANLYKNQEKWDKAEEFYLQAIEKGHVDALNNLASLYYNQYNQEKWDMVEEYYLQAIEKGDIYAPYNLALFYQNQEKWDKAEEYYLQAIEKGHLDALNNLAVLYKNQEKWDKAEKYYLQAINKGDVDALYNLANLYKNQGKGEQAEKYYLQAIEKRHIVALNTLAVLYNNQEKWNKAEEYYLQAIEKGHVDALYNLANLYLYNNQEKWKQAEAYYLQAIEKGHVDALNNLAVLYNNQEKWNKAEEYYLQAIEKGVVDALHNLALLYDNQGKEEQAEKYYLQAIEKGHVGALNNLANLYKNQEKWDKAETYYLQAIEKGNVNALNNLALLYDNQGKEEQAEAYYLQAIEKGHVDALYNLALLYDNQGKGEQAEEYYLQAIENDHLDALNNLVGLYYKLNIKKDKAFELMEVLVTQRPDVLTKLLSVVISVWAGKDDYYQQHREEVLSEIISTSPALLGRYLVMILHHDRSDFILNQFEMGPHVEYLHQNAELVYYVALYFSRPESEQLQHIPEEMKEEFEQLVEHIKEKRAFYAN